MRAFWSAIGAAIGWEEVLLLLALVLLTVGVWPVLGVPTLAIPGAVLLWLVLPQRTAFIARPSPDATQRKR